MSVQERFSWHVFFIHLTSQSFFAWLVWSAFAFTMCWRDGEHDWLEIIVIGYIIVTSIFIGGKSIIGAIAEAIKKSEIKVDL